MGQQFFRRAGEDDTATIDPRARPHVDNVVSTANGLFIVFNHQNRIAEIAHF